jgi:mannose-1-phosphate guanylyltransferase
VIRDIAAFQSAARAALAGAQKDLVLVRLDQGAFEACPSDSIDYAVMEKTADAVVVPLDAGWSDVGSWSACTTHCPPTVTAMLPRAT